MPVKPNSAAIRAMMKKMSAYLSMRGRYGRVAARRQRRA
jgi:hypothetical protein